jgi:eukaryotic-like serine/threonine-protein kinase
VTSSRNRWLTGIIVLVVILIVLFVGMIIAFRPTTVPDVRLKPIAEAQTLIEHVGLKLGTSSRLATTTVGADRVISQRPAPDTRLPSRSSVDVTVAVAPVPLDVPDVVGRDAADATKALSDALFLPLGVDVFGPSPIGTVLDQAPAAGTSWMTGRPVAIGVAAGPDDGTGVKVPDLAGDPLQQALAKLSKVGLNGTGFLTQVNSPTSNVVVDQLPEGGVVVRPGTTVLLLFRAP